MNEGALEEARKHCTEHVFLMSPRLSLWFGFSVLIAGVLIEWRHLRAEKKAIKRVLNVVEKSIQASDAIERAINVIEKAMQKLDAMVRNLRRDLWSWYVDLLQPAERENETKT